MKGHWENFSAGEEGGCREKGGKVTNCVGMSDLGAEKTSTTKTF